MEPAWRSKNRRNRPTMPDHLLPGGMKSGGRHFSSFASNMLVRPLKNRSGPFTGMTSAAQQPTIGPKRLPGRLLSGALWQPDYSESDKAATGAVMDSLAPPRFAGQMH